MAPASTSVASVTGADVDLSVVVKSVEKAAGSAGRNIGRVEESVEKVEARIVVVRVAITIGGDRDSSKPRR